jgi:hypothetical protein
MRKQKEKSQLTQNELQNAAGRGRGREKREVRGREGEKR